MLHSSPGPLHARKSKKQFRKVHGRASSGETDDDVTNLGAKDGSLRTWRAICGRPFAVDSRISWVHSEVGTVPTLSKGSTSRTLQSLCGDFAPTVSSRFVVGHSKFSHRHRLHRHATFRPLRARYVSINWTSCANRSRCDSVSREVSRSSFWATDVGSGRNT